MSEDGRIVLQKRNCCAVADEDDRGRRRPDIISVPCSCVVRSPKCTASKLALRDRSIISQQIVGVRLKLVDETILSKDKVFIGNRC